MNIDLVIKYIEWIAAIAGLGNVYLLTRQNSWAWPLGIITVFLYIFVFYYNRLYSDVILHGIYVLINVYGWYKWLQKPSAGTNSLQVSKLSLKYQITSILLIMVSFISWGTFLQKTTNADYVYADAFILVTSLLAQYLLALKKIENWILWIVVDIVAIVIYSFKGLYVTAGLYSIYFILCIFGYIEWNKSRKGVITFAHDIKL